MPKFLENKLKKEYGAKSSVPYKVMNKMGVMKGNKETAKGVAMDKHHSGKGTKARLNTAAEKHFFNSKVSK
jgi:hypothetical protein